MIIVAGKIFVDPKDRKKFIEGSLEAIKAARKNPACLDFAVSADELDSSRVNVFEKWKSKKALHTFRGEGPGDDLSSMILSADVQEIDV